VRWVVERRSGDGFCVCGCAGAEDDGLMMSGPPGSPPPPAPKAGIATGIAASAPARPARVMNLIASLVMYLSGACERYLPH
jgi:hypothetical protein